MKDEIAEALKNKTINHPMDVIDVVSGIINKNQSVQLTEEKRKAQSIVDLMDESIEMLKAITIRAPNGYKTTIEITGYEFDCIVDYTFTPLCRGGKGDFGQQTEPDEPAHIEMDAVYIKDGTWNLVDIPESAMKDVLDEILEHELG